jgi:chemotaxis protein methyltransferase CheR
MNEDEPELTRLLDAIHAEYHYDFRGYARSSLARRVQRGRAMLGCENVPSLRERVLSDPTAFSQLLAVLTVQVTDLFRDPAYFRRFREAIVPILQKQRTLRLWVPGCATGEEAYSFAIVLAEEGLLERSTIYATDIAENALRRARAGVYPLSRIGSFTENHAAAGGKGSLSDYYTARYDAAIFARGLKEHVVFSDHSLASDDVFAEVQLISCRNVLIYFDPELRRRSLSLFSRALSRRGFLGLGARERLRRDERAPTFAELAAGERWYQVQ